MILEGFQKNSDGSEVTLVKEAQKIYTLKDFLSSRSPRNIRRFRFIKMLLQFFME